MAAQSHPAWVCGLKPDYEDAARQFVKSHPAWVCGLKLHYDFDNNGTDCHTLRGCVD